MPAKDHIYDHAKYLKEMHVFLLSGRATVLLPTNESKVPQTNLQWQHIHTSKFKTKVSLGEDRMGWGEIPNEKNLKWH